MGRTYSWFAFGVAWIALVPLYLAFANNVGFREWCVAVVAAGIATVAGVIYARQRRIRFTFDVRWFREIPCVALTIVTDTGVALQQVVHRMRGRPVVSAVVAVAFDCRDGHTRSAGRRAVAATLLTITPNTVVLDVCAKEPQLAYHELAPRPVPKVVRSLGSRAAGET